ncbi:MAG: adenylyl-sulfate kinase [Pseudonocardia sp.]|nr:adenylyl-sulfate kinase [Pseudonocardia sp.]
MIAPAGLTRAHPTWSPIPRELDDLEMLLRSGYGPLRGFMGSSEVASVVSHGRLADATPWPVAIILTVDRATAAAAADAGALDLLDEEGTPVATLTVEESWPKDGAVGLAGELRACRPIERGCHRALRRRAPDIPGSMTDSPAMLGVPLRRPLQHGELVAMRTVAESLDAHIRLLPLTGRGSPDRLDPVALVQGCLRARDEFTRSGRTTDVVPVSVPRHPACDDERERVLAAMVARAYGATHVPGPLPETEGLPVVVDMPLAAPDPAGAQHPEGLVVMFTGLSGSGKSTLASAVRDAIVERSGRAVTLLDGDVVRRMLSAELSFSRPHRELNVRRIGFVAAEVARHGGIALCAPIAPHAAVRAEVREMVEQAQGRFVLVHVNTPIEVCEGRDRKGLYAKARRGEIPQFTGVSDSYEEPLDADLTVDTSSLHVDALVKLVLDAVEDDSFDR